MVEVQSLRASAFKFKESQVYIAKCKEPLPIRWSRQKPTPLRNGKGYANRLTVQRIVEVQVVVNKPKTDSKLKTVGCKPPTESPEDINAQLNWVTIDWDDLEKRVYQLQKRIYKASRRDDVKTVRRLQKTLTKSWAAKCLAVRRVTQDNQGKKTAGVDGVKSLTPKQRFKSTKNGYKGQTHSESMDSETWDRGKKTFRNTDHVRPRIAGTCQTGIRARMGSAL